VWGRFVNADNECVINCSNELLYNNLFIYCNNNPINMEDENGFFPKKSKPGFKSRKDPRKGSENRQPSGNRERNVGHPDGEEHSRVAKGNRVRRIDTLPKPQPGPRPIITPNKYKSKSTNSSGGITKEDVGKAGVISGVIIGIGKLGKDLWDAWNGMGRPIPVL